MSQRGSGSDRSLERRLAVGRELARIISCRPDAALSQELTRRGRPVVEMHGTRRNHEPVEVMYVVAARRRVPELLALVRQYDPEAPYTITDVKSCHGEEPGATATATEVEKALASRSKRKSARGRESGNHGSPRPRPVRAAAATRGHARYCTGLLEEFSGMSM